MQNSRNDINLRALTEADKLLFFNLYKDPKVMKYIDDIKPDPEIISKIESFPLGWDIAKKGYFCGIIEDKITHQSLGAFVITFKQENEGQVALLQGIILPDFGHRNIMTHALSLLLLLPELASIRLFRAIVTKGNIASEKVLLKNGFKYIETKSNNCKINDVYHDDVFYELAR